MSGGHPYDEPAFADLLAALDGWQVDHLVHPDAELAVAQGAADGAGAILFYDMPGYTFADCQARTRAPTEAFKDALHHYFAAGGGAVALHHALAGWADWPQWSQWLGGRFLYARGAVRGRECLDSGYRHDVPYTARVLCDHPVVAGLPPEFALTDELYLAEVFEGSVTPLIRSAHGFVADNFFSAAHAVAGRTFDNTDWPHPPGSDLIAWTKPVEAGQLVYLQPGDGPAAWASPHYRALLANALAFVART